MSKQSCHWCSLKGHQRRTCHVEAEGRRGPDGYDRLACQIFEGKRTRPEMRGFVAARLRELGVLEGR